MPSYRALLGLCVMVSMFLNAAPMVYSQGQTQPLIVRGKVTMQDGTPPPKPAGLQRICDDIQGSAPGPLTGKDGAYVWRMEVDPMRTRTCRLQADLAGYQSSSINISNLNAYLSTTTDLPTIVLYPSLPDPRTINTADADVPSKSKAAWKTAVKGIETQNLSQAEEGLKAVVEGSSKFGRGWHSLGVIYENLGELPKAQDAYQKAIEADPKSFPSYVTLAKLLLKAKDWQGAAKTADALIKMDSKQPFREVYLHQAVARFRLKDLDGAEASAKEALNPNQKQKIMRAEFVLGRIASARGDTDGARQHISKYIELEPGATDIDQIKTYLQMLGKPEGAGIDPDLEQP
jgi:tetratricopeptide (TPR) repeat protein